MEGKFLLFFILICHCLYHYKYYSNMSVFARLSIESVGRALHKSLMTSPFVPLRRGICCLLLVEARAKQ
jgi:hypothetical protein